jgi:LAO/AO transport system kinase
MWQELLQKVKQGNIKTLARCISLIENEYPGYPELLRLLPVASSAKIIGITGPPGAGKSTLTDALTGEFVKQNKKTGIVCVDPSSPFNLGALLGDRIRMSEWYTNPNVFIRSIATRGSLGGLHPKIIEITDLMKAAPFDIIIVETVGVGQSEIEIAGLADATVVVMVPEAGDEVQTMKAGLMEIADIFVVNKSDRPDADLFVKNLKMMLAPASDSYLSADRQDRGRTHYPEIPVIKTTATQKEGIRELYNTIIHQLQKQHLSDKKYWLLAEKAWQLIVGKRMDGIRKEELKSAIELESKQNTFNLYKFISRY